LARAARARLSSDTSHTIRAGNRIQLIPFHQFSWWNKYQIAATWKARLNIENIFNKGYWASAEGNNNISPASRGPFASRFVRGQQVPLSALLESRPSLRPS